MNETTDKTITGADLVREFNAIAATETGKALGTRPVLKFATTAVGAKRLAALKDSVKAWEAGQSAADAVEKATPKKAVKVKPTKVAGQEGDAEMPKKSSANGAALFEKFATREGTNLAKAVKFLVENVGKQMNIADISAAIYGKKGHENGSGPAKMVLKGVAKHAVEQKTGTVLKWEGRGKDLTYGLHAR